MSMNINVFGNSLQSGSLLVNISLTNTH